MKSLPVFIVNGLLLNNSAGQRNAYLKPDGCMLAATPPQEDGDETEGQDTNDGASTADATPKAKQNPMMSPLAMAAADWVEEEEDELTMYWDRFDAAKSSSKSCGADNDKPDNQRLIQQPSIPNDSSNTQMTTEERLDRYYESHGIDKSQERKHAKQIQAAIDAAKQAASAEEAVKAIEPVRQYLQCQTELCGRVFFELAQALDASNQEEQAENVPSASLRREKEHLEQHSVEQMGLNGQWSNHAKRQGAFCAQQ